MNEVKNDPEALATAALEKGDLRECIRILMDAHGRIVYRYCLSRLHRPDRAEEVVQIVFVEAHRSLPSFAGRSRFRTWLIGIAQHRCGDAVRRIARDNARYGGEPPENIAGKDARDIEKRVVRREVSDALEECLDALEPKKREAVRLRYLVELSYVEMASLLDEQPATLQMRVARSLPWLKSCLEDKGVSP